MKARSELTGSATFEAHLNGKVAGVQMIREPEDLLELT
jgi:hypothetical protein